LHLVDTGEDTGIPDDVVGNIGTILDGGVVSDIAGDDGAVPYTRGNAEIVVAEQHIPDLPQAVKAVEV
jgi:hypothetical protein